MRDAIDPDDEPTPPDQAVLEESEHVLPLPRNRYLISTSSIDDSRADEIKANLEGDADDQASITDDPGRPPLEAAKETIRGSLRTSESMYAIEFTAILEGRLHTDHIETDDVVEAFDDLNRSFAEGIGDDETSASEVFDILHTESRLGGTTRTHDLDDVLAAYGLRPSDSIADLLEAVDNER